MIKGAHPAQRPRVRPREFPVPLPRHTGQVRAALGLGPPEARQAGLEASELATSAPGTLETRPPAESSSRPLVPGPLATGLLALPPRTEAAPAPPDGGPGAGPCPPPRTLPPGPPAPRRVRWGRGPGRPRPTSFPQPELPGAGEAGSLRAGAWRRGGGRKLGVTLPETPDGASAWERGGRAHRD